MGCPCGDIAQEVWFLAWVPHALGSLANPFTTTLINYPFGVNLANNTSMPLLGLLASPITLLFGPIAAFNLLIRLAFALSATSMMFAVRHYTRWFPAAFLAGLLYGFSPYIVGAALGHLFLAFVPIPPLVVVVVDELIRTQQRSRRRYGIYLGLLLAAQLLISVEVFATTLILCAIGVVVVALRFPRSVRARALHALKAGAWALVALGPVVGYFAYVYFAGPWHIVGPSRAASTLASYRIDLLGPIVPTTSELLAPAHLAAIGSSYAAGALADNGSYLGIPVIVFAVAVLVRLWRDRFITSIAAVGLAGFILSLGSPLTVNNHATSVPLPFEILRRISTLSDIIASRMSLYVVVAAAFVFGIGVDRLHRDLLHYTTRRSSRKRVRIDGSRVRRRTIAVESSLAIVSCALLIALIPRVPLASKMVSVPSYFTTSDVRQIPSGSSVLIYPYDTPEFNEGMFWQAISGMSYSIFGGEVSQGRARREGHVVDRVAGTARDAASVSRRAQRQRPPHTFASPERRGRNPPLCTGVACPHDRRRSNDRRKAGHCRRFLDAVTPSQTRAHRRNRRLVRRGPKVREFC